MEGILKDLGPCIVNFNSVDIGPTAGDVIFKFNTESKPVKEDQKGVTTLDEIIVGVGDCSVEVPLTRTTLANLATLIPGASANSSSLQVKNDTMVGKSRYSSAQTLILKPIVNGVAAAQTSWLTINKASPSVNFEIVYNNEGQRIYKVSFKGYPDASSGNIWKIG